MKTLKKISMMAVTLMLAAASVNAQDCIVTNNGHAIKANVKKVKNNMVVYSKHFHRSKIATDKVLYVQYSNGSKTTFNAVNTAKNYKNYSLMASSTSTQPTQKNDSLMKKLGGNVTPTGGHVYSIERIGNSFRLDTNQIVGLHQINQIMAASGNPTVLVNLKAAKTIRFFHTMSTIAAFPSTSGGGYASFMTFQNLFNQMKSGPAPFKSYLSAGLSFMATISLPITSKILQHIQNKLYDRTLVMYSAGM